MSNMFWLFAYQDRQIKNVFSFDSSLKHLNCRFFCLSLERPTRHSDIQTKSRIFVLSAPKENFRFVNLYNKVNLFCQIDIVHQPIYLRQSDSFLFPVLHNTRHFFFAYISFTIQFFPIKTILLSTNNRNILFLYT